MIGKTLDGYRVLRLIGEGGMGAVYEAHHEVLDRSVALKVIRPELASTDRLVKRFLREARALARLTHPAMTTIYSVGTAEGVLYMALELIAGRTVKAVLDAEGPFTVERAVAVLLQVLGALDAAHEHRIVHRDLKPDNLMLVPGTPERLKLLDFGLVKLLEREEEETAASWRTAALVAVGTPAYMAPEQVMDGHNVDHRADLYAAGVVLYQLLTGEVPFDGLTPTEVFAKKLSKPPPAVRLLRPDVPVSLEEVIFRALARDPDDRFRTARELAAALEATRDDRPPAGAPTAAPGTRGRRFRRSGAAAALGPTQAAADRPTKPPEGRLAGKTLATYRLDRLIATARTGELYEALDMAFDRIVAVKVSHRRPDALERLRKEALLLARLGAPAAFDVVETGSQDGDAFLVLLGLSGRPLAHVLRETGRFPPERAVACATALLAALEPLHALGVVHRDVEPANVLVTVEEKGETFRLLDFSLAAEPRLPGAPADAYASPEQRRDEPLDARSDLYSVARLLEELVKGREGQAAPPALRAILDRALAERPAERFPDARTFAAALEGARLSPAPEPPRADGALAGRKIGRYRFEERLAVGSLGEVHRAIQLDLRRPVAVRVLAPELAADKEIVKEMVRSARAVARLSHPAIAAVHEVVLAPPFVAHELVPGRRLPDVLKEGPLSVERATAFALRILYALAEAHDHDVIHGCLESSSIVLAADKKELPKIVDFGVHPVRAIAALRAGRSGVERARAYAPPERGSGEGPTVASDLFAAACVFSEMLTGQPVDLLARSARRARPEVPEAVDAVLLKALGLRPEGRYQSARDFAGALRIALPGNDR